MTVSVYIKSADDLLSHAKFFFPSLILFFFFIDVFFLPYFCTCYSFHFLFSKSWLCSLYVASLFDFFKSTSHVPSWQVIEIHDIALATHLMFVIYLSGTVIRMFLAVDAAKMMEWTHYVGLDYGSLKYDQEWTPPQKMCISASSSTLRTTGNNFTSLTASSACCYEHQQKGRIKSWSALFCWPW